MVINSFFTVEAPSQGLYKEKGSKFLAFSFPVINEEDIKNHLVRLRKEYYDARHHCYAWMLGADKNKFRAVDDGEPNHSAGDPILGQIRSKEITNVLIVVVRYFGGTKLGVGGLIVAYKTAAEAALKNATIVEKEITHAVKFVFPYETTAEIMRVVKEFHLIITHQSFAADCRLHVEVTNANWEAFNGRLKVMKDMGVLVDTIFL